MKNRNPLRNRKRISDSNTKDSLFFILAQHKYAILLINNNHLIRCYQRLPYNVKIEYAFIGENF